MHFLFQFIHFNPSTKSEHPSGTRCNSEKRRKDERDENGLADHG